MNINYAKTSVITQTKSVCKKKQSEQIPAGCIDYINAASNILLQYEVSRITASCAEHLTSLLYF